MPAGRLCLYYRRRSRGPVLSKASWAAKRCQHSVRRRGKMTPGRGARTSPARTRRRSTRTRRAAAALEARGRPVRGRARAPGAAVRARALELPELAAAGTVMLFASFRTRARHRAASPTGRCAPARRSACRGSSAPGAWRRSASPTWPPTSSPGKWDIPEPREGLPEVAPEDDRPRVRPGFGLRRGGRPLRLRRRLLRQLPAAHAAGHAVGRAGLRGAAGADDLPASRTTCR